MSKPVRAMPFGSRRLWAAVAALAACGIASGALAKEAKEKTGTKSTQEKSVKVKGEGGYLGVYMQELNDDVRKGLDIQATTKGVLISGVEKGSPAEKAGIEEGDIILKFDGEKVTTPDELRSAVSALEPGAEAAVDVLHKGETSSLNVTVGEREDSAWFAYGGPDGDEDIPGVRRFMTVMGGPRLGVQAHEIDNGDLGDYFGVKPGDGVLVLGVDKDSPAGKAGVEPGDVIRQVGEEKITDMGDLRRAVRDFEAGDDFTITVRRHGKTESLKATMDEDNVEAFHMPPDVRWNDFRHVPRPRVRAYDRQRIEGEIRNELDDLRQQIQELKEQLDRKDG